MFLLSHENNFSCLPWISLRFLPYYRKDVQLLFSALWHLSVGGKVLAVLSHRNHHRGLHNEAQCLWYRCKICWCLLPVNSCTKWEINILFFPSVSLCLNSWNNNYRYYEHMAITLWCSQLWFWFQPCTHCMVVHISPFTGLNWFKKLCSEFLVLLALPIKHRFP